MLCVQVSEERYRVAQAVMGELSSSIRGALQEGYVFVLPTVPTEAPSTDCGGSGSSSSSEGEAFKQRSLEFSALAALAGVPEVRWAPPPQQEVKLVGGLWFISVCAVPLRACASAKGAVLCRGPSQGQLHIC